MMTDQERVKRSIPVSAAKQLIRNANAQRISGEAAKALIRILEGAAVKVAENAVQIAKYVDHVTVLGSDILLSFKYWRNQEDS